MKEYLLKPTGTTPLISFKPSKGEMEIIGVSNPYDPLSFFGVVYDRLTDFDQSNTKVVKANFALKEFSGCTNYIYVLIKKLVSLSNDGRDVIINWYYEKDNEEMRKAGEEISAHYGHEFNFIKVFKIKEHLRVA